MYIINIPDVVLECYSVCAFVDRVDDECMSQQKQTSWTTYSAYNHFFNVMFSNFMQLLSSVVQIIDGKDLLNERTNTELRYLKKASALSFYLLLDYPSSLVEIVSY